MKPIRFSLRTYCRTMFLSAGGVLSTLALLNYCVDPYDVYYHATSSYFRSCKRRVVQRIAKAEAARRGMNEVILLGDSRVGFGLDPSHPALRQFGEGFNLALAAGSVYENSRMLDLALQNDDGAPKVVVWGLPPEFVIRDRRPCMEFDFESSLLNEKLTATDYHFQKLLSFDTTRFSLHAAFSRATLSPEEIAKWEIQKGYLGTKTTPASVDVSHRLFMEVLPAHGGYLSESLPLPEVPEMEATLRRCFGDCRKRGIYLKVVVPPVHAVYLDHEHQLGLSDRIDFGKRVLVRLAREANSMSGTGPDVEIWDFTGFSGPMVEVPPAVGGVATMSWYQDAIHFRKTLGDAVLNRIFGLPCEVAGFGILLNEANLEHHMAMQHDDRRAYRHNRPGQIRIASEGVVTPH